MDSDLDESVFDDPMQSDSDVYEEAVGRFWWMLEPNLDLSCSLSSPPSPLLLPWLNSYPLIGYVRLT